METWFTDQWQRNGPWQLLLRPLSWAFGGMAAIRRLGYRQGWLDSRSVAAPVIIVGNISVGGTGKTPLVLALVEALTTRGKHCGIITRGYQRRSNAAVASVIHVVPERLEYEIVSDEASLLARRSGVPVYAGANRVDAAQTLLRNHPEVDVIISDDGLQHYALKRDVEICVIDGVRGLGNGALLPAGPLREAASRLDMVDVVIVNRNGGNAGVFHLDAATPTFDMTLANELFVNLKTGERVPGRDALDGFAGERIHALAGTGNPQRFFAHLARLGIRPVSTASFPDHHNYCASDMPGNEAEIVLMTEKDAVKCGLFADARMWFMRVDAMLPTSFTEFVLQKLNNRKT